jgi:hypothetical protein
LSPAGGGCTWQYQRMSEQARAWVIVIVVYAAIAALIFGPVTHYESNPCQWWLDEHGDLHPRC